MEPFNTIDPSTLEMITGGQNLSESVGLPPTWKPSTAIDRLAWAAADKGLQLYRRWTGGSAGVADAASSPDK